MIGQSPQAELLRLVPAVETLRQVWLQQYYVEDGRLCRRKPENLPPSSRRIISPYDTEARFSVRRSTKWEGYRVHVTETCDSDQPLLITNVETTASASLDLQWTDAIHQHLQEKDLLPSEHLVDAGYMDACALAEGESKYGLDLVGPVKQDVRWHGKPRQEKAMLFRALSLTGSNSKSPARKERPMSAGIITTTPAEDH